MSPLPTMVFTLLTMAMVLVAPHLDWTTAKIASLVCILLAVIFIALDLGVSK